MPVIVDVVKAAAPATGQLLWKLPVGIVLGLVKFIIGLGKFAYLHGLDLGVFLGNILTPKLKKGSVVKKGIPGHGGEWPPYVAPTDTDSRSPCPYLNALANHGVLPHSGRNIPLSKIESVMHDTLNFSKTLCKDTVNTVQGLYNSDHIDLGYLSAHGVVEHDASLIRHDAAFVPDQRIIAHDLVDAMLNSATGPATEKGPHPQGYLKPSDLSKVLAQREAESLRDNPVFAMSFAHRFFGASNASLMYETVEGDVEVLKTILHEERFPDGFETRLRQRFGYSMKEFHLRSFQIHLSRPRLPKLGAKKGASKVTAVGVA